MVEDNHVQSYFSVSENLDETLSGMQSNVMDMQDELHLLRNDVYSMFSIIRENLSEADEILYTLATAINRSSNRVGITSNYLDRSNRMFMGIDPYTSYNGGQPIVTLSQYTYGDFIGDVIESASTGATLGGAVGGQIGTAAGAIAGTTIPGPGTASGAATGAGLGAAAGALWGMGIGAAVGVGKGIYRLVSDPEIQLEDAVVAYRNELAEQQIRDRGNGSLEGILQYTAWDDMLYAFTREYGDESREFMERLREEARQYNYSLDDYLPFADAMLAYRSEMEQMLTEQLADDADSLAQALEQLWGFDDLLPIIENITDLGKHRNMDPADTLNLMRAVGDVSAGILTRENLTLLDEYGIRIKEYLINTNAWISTDEELFEALQHGEEINQDISWSQIEIMLTSQNYDLQLTLADITTKIGELHEERSSAFGKGYTDARDYNAELEHELGLQGELLQIEMLKGTYSGMMEQSQKDLSMALENAAYTGSFDQLDARLEELFGENQEQIDAVTERLRGLNQMKEDALEALEAGDELEASYLAVLFDERLQMEIENAFQNSDAMARNYVGDVQQLYYASAIVEGQKQVPNRIVDWNKGLGDVNYQFQDIDQLIYPLPEQLTKIMTTEDIEVLFNDSWEYERQLIERMSMEIKGEIKANAISPQAIIMASVTAFASELAKVQLVS